MRRARDTLLAKVVPQFRTGKRGLRHGDDKHLTDAHAARHYAAIIELSDDAILSKDLEGVIISWNRAAQRLFGYTAEEVVGRSVTMIIPTDRRDEEPMILERVRRGRELNIMRRFVSARTGASLTSPLLFRRSKMKRARL